MSSIDRNPLPSGMGRLKIPEQKKKKDFDVSNMPDDTRSTRGQLRYYHVLCKEVGIPYDVAQQQAVLKFDMKFKLISERIKELEKMVYFNKIMEVAAGDIPDVMRVMAMGTKQSWDEMEDVRRALSKMKDGDMSYFEKDGPRVFVSCGNKEEQDVLVAKKKQNVFFRYLENIKNKILNWYRDIDIEEKAKK
ncbi:MAG: hypothetical protein DDT19_01044 [Syntrophomonadaceae bacterium]|nr:hypothetical protein [Bacillota bacterium]